MKKWLCIKQLFLPLSAICFLLSCSPGDSEKKEEKTIQAKDATVRFSYDSSLKYAVKCKTKAQLPVPAGYVNDFERLFTDKEEATLDSMISAHEKETGNQVAIITVDSAMLAPCTIIDYANDIGNAWGVGQKEKNNGIVIALCAKCRQIRISNGSGILKKLSNEATQSIINDIIIPEFKQADYFEGIRKGLLAIMEKVK